ncbi:PhoH family protein [bacterium Scap17]|nr:PhoH family protein [bacterium Scap17]
MVRVEKQSRRLYVLDTNVLIHDPSALFQFDEHDVVIPMTVLEELDKHKNGHKEIAHTARQISRTLSDLTADVTPQEILRGIPLPPSMNGAGNLHFLSGNVDQSDACADNRILAETRSLATRCQDASVILVTKDINLRIKAAALGMAVEDYLTDRAFTDSDAMIEGVKLFHEAGPDGQGVWDDLQVDVTVTREHHRTFYDLSGQMPKDWYPGMLIADCDGDDGASFEAIVRELEHDYARLEVLQNYRNERSAWGVNAHDSRQNFALNLLMDDSVDMVSIAGSAGTGKTYMTLAAAFEQTLEKKRFERIIFTRAPIAMGEEIGFLPGTEEEKMSPWMGAFHDNMDNLLRKEGEGTSAWNEEATRAWIGNRVQIRSPSFMRGRTLSDTFLIIDEAQNLTPKQLKGLLTRAGANTKVVLLGNVGQIDTPYLTANTCGLAVAVQRFSSWPHASHVTLKCVERSRLALVAEELL